LSTDIRVCLLNDSFPPVIDGVSNAVLNYATIIQKNYGNAVVATPLYPGVKDNYDFPVQRYPSVNLRLKALRGYRAGYPFDLVTLHRLQAMNLNLLHSHCPVASTVLARTLRELMDIPIIFTYHTKFDIDIYNAVNGKIIQNAAKRLLVENIRACDEVWVVSRGAGDNLRSLGYQGSYTVMENGVDLKKGRADEDEIEKQRLRYKLDPELPTFIFVGRLMWYKGLRMILESMAALKAKGIAFRMVFVGGGGQETEVRELSDSLNLGNECIFTGAIYDREVLRALYTLSDLLLFPSTYDTNGLVVREAAACGLASVLIQGSCAAEGVVDGRNGLLMEDDREALVETLVKAIEHRDKLKQIGQAAMDEIYISWEDSVKKAVDRYGVVLENWRSTGKHKPKLRPEELNQIARKLYGEIERLKTHSINKIEQHRIIRQEYRNSRRN
jgi:glycosyltransferase involved in cell wall biosynthesis